MWDFWISNLCLSTYRPIESCVNENSSKSECVDVTGELGNVPNGDNSEAELLWVRVKESSEPWSSDDASEGEVVGNPVLIMFGIKNSISESWTWNGYNWKRIPDFQQWGVNWFHLCRAISFNKGSSNVHKVHTGCVQWFPTQAQHFSHYITKITISHLYHWKK